MKTMINSKCKVVMFVFGLLAGQWALADDTLTPKAQDAKSALFDIIGIKQLVVQGGADVHIVQGDSEQIVINANAETREQIELARRENKITIKQNGNWKFWNTNKVKMIVTIRDLEEVSLLGSGDVNCNGPVKLAKLKLKISGSGDIHFKDATINDLSVSIAGSGDVSVVGQGQSACVSIAGSGDYVGNRFKANTACISIAGAGDAKIWAVETLSISIAGAGTVEYWGDPKIAKQSILGAGEVIRRGGAQDASTNADKAKTRSTDNPK